MVEKTKQTGSKVPASRKTPDLDRDKLAGEYKQSREALLQDMSVEDIRELSEEELLDLAVEMCR